MFRDSCRRVVSSTLLIIMGITAHAEYRIWEGTNGSTVEAELISSSADSVRIRKRDGNIVSVPLVKLSETDREYVEQYNATMTKTPEATIYEIRGVGKTSQKSWVEGKWRAGHPCLEVRVSSQEKKNRQDVQVRAYFFNKEKQLVLSRRNPSGVVLPGGRYSAPEVYEKNRGHDVFFAIPEEISSGKDRWKYAVVVFGSSGHFIAERYPKSDDGPDYLFDKETGNVTAEDGVQENTLNTADSDAAKESTYEISRLGDGKEYALIDRAWTKNTPCIKARVSSSKEVSGKQLTFKAYFFNKTKSLVHTSRRPSRTYASSKKEAGSEVYHIPKTFERKEDYDIYFAIPSAIRDGDLEWRYVVMVFGVEGRFTARSYPKADLAEFDFAEKASLADQ